MKTLFAALIAGLFAVSAFANARPLRPRSNRFIPIEKPALCGLFFLFNL